MKRSLLSVGPAGKPQLIAKRFLPKVTGAWTAAALSFVALGVWLGVIRTLSEMAKPVSHRGLQGYCSFQSRPAEPALRSSHPLISHASASTEYADAALTQAVLEEIMQPENGFVNLDILVKTVRGRVMLAGTVKNEKQKKRVIAAVEHVAGTGNVEDQLETSGQINPARL